MARLRYEHEDQQYFESLPDWRRDFSLYYYHKKAAFLSLISANPYLMDGIDTKKIFAQQKAQNEALKEYIDGMMASKTTWLVAAVPSAIWDKLLYPDSTPTPLMKPCGSKSSSHPAPTVPMPWPTGTPIWQS